MASFCPVNLPLPAVAAPRHGSVGQVSPRWMAQIRGNTSSSNPQHPMARNELRTSTQPPSTHGTFVNQRPLPILKPFLSPYTAVSTEAPRLKPKQQHPQSQSREEERAEMIGTKEKKESTEPGSEELVEGSGNKKKGKIQRFYCGNFPPCNLSFTRSEHLARHIRKHTGERPFQCHCSRRFSRLDNLRQHAQTVHQHEPIPLNSLAATGTRFQRQGRDKGKSQRNKTKGNQSGPVRGHKRNSVSTSSIGSVTSTLSSLGYAETQRPKSQLITSSERGRGVADISVNCSSPNQFMTPASASTLNHHESPQWSPAIQSPASSYTHMPSVYEDPPSHYRRSSISSVSMGNPFKSPTRAHPVPSMHTKSLSLSNIPPKSPAKSDNRMRWLPYEVVRSPDGTSRRRTWHPEMGTSHMMQEPNFSIRDTRDVPPQQSMSQGNHQSLPPVRLPGIESFDSPPRLESPYSNSDERRPRPWPWDSVLLRIGAHGRPSR